MAHNLTLLLRLSVIALAGPLLIIAGLSALLWWRAEYPSPEERVRPVALDGVAKARFTAVRARFEALPAPQQSAIIDHVRTAVQPLTAWLSGPAVRRRGILCVGENHRDVARDFIARRLMPKLAPDILLLEATEAATRGLIQRAEADRAFYPLLGANILGILRTARATNPDVRIHGIEETEAQRRRTHPPRISRDRSITDNALTRLRADRRHLILYGALHCSETPGRLHRLLETVPGIGTEGITSLRVLGDRHEPQSQAFVRFLRHAGAPEGAFVLQGRRSIGAFVDSEFALVRQQLLDRFDTIIIFTER